MNNLTAHDFPAFFKAIHDVEPFPWQNELARRVLQIGRWPSLLDLPTGAGKTAAIDIAVFHLACEAEKGAHRKAPLRILFVIDRRIVVDAAFERAKKIVAALRYPKTEIVKNVANRLSVLSGDPKHPLDVVRLRGGVPQERDWARSPAQPLVAVSTVDQVGSRLLFRGYGVSPKMWPVHAGLVGSDALWLLDEVHLSKPFEETLDAIAGGHGETGNGVFAERPRLAPFFVVKLSATPGAEKPDDVFPGKDFDIRKGAPQHFLDRLESRKLASLVQIDGDAAGAFTTHALLLAGLVQPEEQTPSKRSKKRKKNADAEPAPVASRRVAVVINRVDFARRVFETVAHKAGDMAETILLTGRVRPLDRERILKRLEPLQADLKRPEPEKPIILVATQTIEAGADLDVDALVTEIAPLDSLRQRFGRLDRLGMRKESRAAILHPAGKPAKGDKEKDNPWTPVNRIYGRAAYETKAWLDELGDQIDFGINGFEEKMESLDNDRLEKLLAPRAQAPVLLPPFAELWATTSPRPFVTPEPSLFLHGPGTSADVQVVWRADIDPQKVTASHISLDLCPPASGEAMSVPIWAVQRWLRQEREFDFADVPQKNIEGRDGGQSRGLPVLRRDEESWTRFFTSDIKPGDTIVVPTLYGGCDAWGWAPLSKTEVADLGTEAHYRQRLKAALRVTPGTLANALTSELVTDGSAVAAEIWDRIGRFVSESANDVDGESIRTMLLAEDGLPETWRRLLGGIKSRQLVIEFYDAENPLGGFILHARKQLASILLDGAAEETGDGPDSSTDRGDSSSIGVKVTLTDHLRHVEKAAHEFARRAGLDDRLAHLIGLAARLHDLGKADPRFQADLQAAGALVFRDPEFAALLTPSGELLAKSERTGNGRTARFRGLRAAPDDFRHEALSVALAGKQTEVAALPDDERDLVLWLIGTHHGFGRPFFPPCIDPASHIEVRVQIGETVLFAEAADAPLRLDQGWFERVERLTRRYGPWELARLEAIVRLADHAASAQEQDSGDTLPAKEDVQEVNP